MSNKVASEEPKKEESKKEESKENESKEEESKKEEPKEESKEEEKTEVEEDIPPSSASIKTSAESEWFTVAIVNKSGQDLKVKDASLDWGKFVWQGRIEKGSYLNKKTIGDTCSMSISATGRANSSSGAQGSFNLNGFLKNKDDQTIFACKFDCPYSGGNPFSFDSKDKSSYEVKQQPKKICASGPLGSIVITVSKIAT
eukprot:184795_1